MVCNFRACVFSKTHLLGEAVQARKGEFPNTPLFAKACECVLFAEQINHYTHHNEVSYVGHATSSKHAKTEVP